MTIKPLFELNTTTEIKARIQKNLSDNPFKWITNIGFRNLSRDLVSWLVYHYDTKNSVMNVHDMKIVIDDAEVGRAFGIPATGEEIKIDDTDDSGFKKYGHLFTMTNKNRIDLVDLKCKLMTDKSFVGESFKVGYLAYVFGVLFFAESTVGLHPKYLNPLVDIEDLENKNWAKLIRETTNSDIDRYQTDSQRGYIGYCPLMLEVKTI